MRHPRLHREGIVIFNHGLQLAEPLTRWHRVGCVGSGARLISDKFRGTSVDTADTGGVLGGEYCEETFLIPLQRGERLRVPLRNQYASSKILGECRVDLGPSTSRNITSRDGQHGQTPGFALAKGLVRGLTRCPNPPSRFYGTTHFWMNVGESVLCLTVDASLHLTTYIWVWLGEGQP